MSFGDVHLTDDLDLGSEFEDDINDTISKKRKLIDDKLPAKRVKYFDCPSTNSTNSIEINQLRILKRKLKSNTFSISTIYTLLSPHIGGPNFHVIDLFDDKINVGIQAEFDSNEKFARSLVKLIKGTSWMHELNADGSMCIYNEFSWLVKIKENNDSKRNLLFNHSGFDQNCIIDCFDENLDSKMSDSIIFVCNYDIDVHLNLRFLADIFRLFANENFLPNADMLIDCREFEVEHVFQLVSDVRNYRKICLMTSLRYSRDFIEINSNFINYYNLIIKSGSRILYWHYIATILHGLAYRISDGHYSYKRLYENTLNLYKDETEISNFYMNITNRLFHFLVDDYYLWNTEICKMNEDIDQMIKGKFKVT